VRRRKLAAIVATGMIALAAQLIRPSRDNPLVRGDLAAPTKIKLTLRRACYDCHSNETKWPWYSAIAPMGWLVSRHVHDARNHLNFSDWGDYVSDPGTAAEKFKAIAQTIGSRAMPPWYYRIAHQRSRLSTSDCDQLIEWARKEAGRAAASAQ
jgi:hypothetical protein